MHDAQATATAILKYLGLVVSLVSGMIATAFETKEDDGKGSKRLSRFGRIVFSCVVLGSLISAGTQLMEDRQKRLDAIKAATAREDDIKRISFVIDGTQRIAYPIKPMVWGIQVRYKIDDHSPLLPYVRRIQSEHRGVQHFNLYDDYVPNPDNFYEYPAYQCLTLPSIFVSVLPTASMTEDRKKRNIGLGDSVPLFFEANKHEPFTGKPIFLGRPVLPPFTSTVFLEQKLGGLWLVQRFEVRDSPEATIVTGVISPLDLSDYSVVAEAMDVERGIVETVTMQFPTANSEINVSMAPADPIARATRSIGTLNALQIRKALGVVPIPVSEQKP